MLGAFTVQSKFRGKNIRSLLAFVALCCGAISAESYAADLQKRPPITPFAIEAGPDVSARFPGAPRLHSFAWAQWDGKWIFIGGRSGGYHGVGGIEVDFPRATANARIWVVDPTVEGAARTYSFPISELPDSLASVKDQWMSTNPLFIQDGDSLYIVGGYGQNSKGAWVTYPLLSAVSLPALVDGVLHGRDTFSSTISFTESPLVQVTGGEMLKLDDGLFYIVGGHTFMGTYSEFESSNEKNDSHASQTYTGEIRKVSIKRERNAQVSIALVERFQDPEFARRDLNVTYRILPDGHTLGGAAYGGVFTKEQLNFKSPIYWNASAPPAIDRAFEQKVSSYTCANMLFFDPDSRTMYTTFLGGISGWTWDYERQVLAPAPLHGDKNQQTYFDGLSWIDHISTLIQTKDRTIETIQPANRLPGYIGTNAVFLPAPGLQKIRPDADIFDVRPLRGKRTLVGYIYGGIRAYPKEFPYRDDSRDYRAGSVPTKASDLIVPVYVTVPATQ